MEKKDILFKSLNSSDVACEFEKIYNIIKELVDIGVTIKEIDDKCLKLPAYEIIDYLIRYGSDDINNFNVIKNYYDSLRINQDRCLIIADNHMGRLKRNEVFLKTGCYENEKGLYCAYNHALAKGINNVIHLGDILEGNSDSGQYRLKANPYQIEYLERVYPRVENVKTYLLYGNHDYNLIYFNGVDRKFYKVCTNMELIGVNYSYMNFCGHRIKLSHESKMSNSIKNIELPYNFELAGHSHLYDIIDEHRLLRVPSLSSISVEGSSIGYLEMINEENEFLFKFFDHNGNEIKSKEKVLMKKH